MEFLEHLPYHSDEQDTGPVPGEEVGESWFLENLPFHLDTEPAELTVSVPLRLRKTKSRPLTEKLLNVKRSEKIDLMAARRFSHGTYKQKLVLIKEHPCHPLLLLKYTNNVGWDKKWDRVPNFIRESNGLVVDYYGNIVTRPIQKFFNWDEVESMPIGKGRLVEKLDGSIINVSHWMGNRIVSSHGSFASDQSKKAEHILDTKYSHIHLDSNFTYCFEVIYPTNRVIVDYGELVDLFLFAKIETVTGIEEDCFFEQFAKPKIQYVFENLKTVEELLDIFSGLDSDCYSCQTPIQEGSVLEIKDCRIKIKTDAWFCEKNRLKNAKKIKK